MSGTEPGPPDLQALLEAVGGGSAPVGSHLALEALREALLPHLAQGTVPKLTVDGVLVRGQQVLLVRRGIPPHQGQWALPGGFVDPPESLESAVARELAEETGLQCRPIGLVGAFATPGRDPRGPTATVAYLMAAADPEGEPQGGSDAAEAAFVDLASASGLAFDHDEILAAGLRALDRG